MGLQLHKEQNIKYAAAYPANSPPTALQCIIIFAYKIFINMVQQNLNHAT